MAEYIEREAAIKMLLSPITMSMCLSVEECRHKQDQMFIDVGLIKSVPAADVAPVRHGRWIKTGDFSDEPTDWVACDRCKAKIPDFDYSYCPNCGAKMEVDK